MRFQTTTHLKLLIILSLLFNNSITMKSIPKNELEKDNLTSYLIDCLGYSQDDLEGNSARTLWQTIVDSGNLKEYKDFIK